VELGVALARGTTTLRSALFFRRDKALVDWTFPFTATTARTANAVDIDTLGFESVATLDWSRLRLVLGYTFLDKSADYRGAARDASFYAMNFARHRLTAAVVARLGGGFELRMDNAARIQENNRLRATGGDETVISSAGLFYLPAAVPGLEISLTADNLWNSNFQEIPAVPAPDRQISAGVTYRW
jgi:hypothetical protein